MGSDDLNKRNAAKRNLRRFKTSFISAEVCYTYLVNYGRIVSEITVDVFEDYEDPDWYATYKVEELEVKNFFAPCSLHLN
jgi:hypothetical protein